MKWFEPQYGKKLRLMDLTIDDEKKAFLLQGPSSSFKTTFRVGSKPSTLLFSLGVDPATSSKARAPIRYELRAAPMGGSARSLFHFEIDPRQPGHRHWLPFSVEVPFTDQWIELEIVAESTSPDEAGGGWGDLRLTPEVPRPQHRVAYQDRDMRSAGVVENPNVWPRVFAVADPIRETTGPKVLERIKGMVGRGGLFAVVESDFPEAEWRKLCPGGACAAQTPQPHEIRDFRARTNDVAFEVHTAQPGVLVLSEMLTPGWTARVDGVDTTLFHANYVFRGVLVPAGRHRVSFAYWPSEWTMALTLSGTGILIVSGAFLAWLLARRRSRRASASPPVPEGIAA
jgi:hypothetical protein